jgi:PAS domain S-box-containing protein
MKGQKNGREVLFPYGGQKMSLKQDQITRLDRLVGQLSEKESILNGISDAIMLLDAKIYKILDINNAFLDIYKTNRKQVLGKTCHEITHQNKKPCSHYFGDESCPLEASVSTGNLAHAEHVHKDHNGKTHYFEITAYPLKNFAGEVTRVVHISRDVTDRRLAEEALKEKLTRSEHLAAMGQLVAEIAHEIKNPLMMIGGFARQLLHTEEKKDRLKKLTIISEQSERLEKLLSELREYYVPRNNATETVDIREVLKKVYSLVKDQCEKKKIHTELFMDGNQLMVNGDPNKLEQVFLNVIKNSIEAMSTGGNLSVRAGVLKDKVEITIEDDGCGIPAEHMDKILDCFFTTKSYGTGLGLCLSKKYVDDHEGSFFRILSTEGKGTSVHVGLSALEKGYT